MSNYNGARKKTNFGNRNVKSQSTETGAKNRNYFTQNGGGGNGWGNTSRSSKSTNDDGWGDVGRSNSNYTSDDLWGPLPSQPAVTENAWGRRGSKKNQRSYTNQGKKPVPLVGPNFSWDEDEYPALESRQPVENYWEKRKEKMEGRIAMEPTSMTEEELMIQKAIELSKREAREEEERRRHIEEEYELQNLMLTRNPEFFSDFLTPEELTGTNKTLEPVISDYQYNDFKNDYVGNDSIWNVSEPIQNQKQDQKNNKKKKRDKLLSSRHNEDAWSDNQKSDHDKENKTVLPEQLEHQDNWSQNTVSNNCYNETKDDSEFVDEDDNYSSANLASTTSADVKNEKKSHKDIQPKISKAIDMFGGWGSNSTQNSSLKSSLKQERFESYDDFSYANSVSNDEEIYQDNWEQPKEMFECGESLQLSNNSSKHRESEVFSTNEKDPSSLNEEASWNSKYSSNDDQYNNELKHSLYSHVESSIAASASSSFCNAPVAISSDSGASFSSQKSVPKDEHLMNTIVQDYASLAVNCTDSSTKESVPIQREPKDIFSIVAPLLNDDNLKPDITDFRQSSVDMTQNLSTQVVNPTSKSEIVYSLNNTAPVEVSNKAPNENIAGPWNDSDIGFSANSGRNEINDSLFLHPNNEPVNLYNHHEDYPVDSVIPPPIQQETPITCQPNPLMGNFMMGLNPMMFQQVTMLSNPFFLQQLHQMQMYYTAMSMPFNSPLIAPMPIPHFNPMSNNVSNFLNDDPNLNVNSAPEQSVENNTSIPFENEINMPSNSDTSAPNIEFENSWLSDLLSEGAAHMDSFIPPPTMPVTNPLENPPLAPNVGNHVDTNIAQDSLQSTYGNDISQNSNYDKKDLKQESSTIKYDETEDASINTRNVNSSNIPKSSVPEVVEATGWGDIDDVPKNKYTSWNDDGWGDIDVPKNNNASWNNDVGSWGDKKITSSKSMINSSRYSSRKQATTRQPIRQPRQASQW